MRRALRTLYNDGGQIGQHDNNRRRDRHGFPECRGLEDWWNDGWAGDDDIQPDETSSVKRTGSWEQRKDASRSSRHR